MIDKNLEDLRRLNGDATSLDAAFQYLEKLRAQAENQDVEGETT